MVFEQVADFTYVATWRGLVFVHRRLFEPNGNLPPAQKRDEYYRQRESPTPDSQPGVSGIPGPDQLAPWPPICVM